MASGRWVAGVLCGLAWTALPAGVAGAQEPVTFARSLQEGDCNVAVRGKTWNKRLKIRGTEITVPADLRPTDTGIYIVPLSAPLHSKEEVALLGEDSKQVASARVEGYGGRVIPVPTCSTKSSLDERQPLLVTFDVGWMSETFAPQKAELQDIYNAKGVVGTPNESAFKNAGRRSTVFDASYRLPIKRFGNRPLWLATSALYGRRSTTCLQDTSTTTAAGETPSADLPCSDSVTPAQTLVDIKQADTAEYYIGGRWEYAHFGAESPVPAAGYVNCSFGAIFVAGVGNKAISNSQCGGGVTLIGGQFRESYVEMGYGISEIFAPDNSHWNHWKTRVFITTRLLKTDPKNVAGKFLNSVRPFVTLVQDRGHGPDSFTTNVGFLFDFGTVFGVPGR